MTDRLAGDAAWWVTRQERAIGQGSLNAINCPGQIAPLTPTTKYCLPFNM